MTDRKIIVVLGATGAQGGGLIRAIHTDPASRFRARAVTRNPASDKAKALAALGAEVVAGDVSDPASIARAFQGAYGAYCVTFFWDHFSAERETAEARQMAQAAKGAGLAHVIWSTLEDVRTFVPLSDTRMPTLREKYKVPHFDGKGEADAFFRELGVPTTFYYASFYWDNFIYFGAGPKPGPDGQLQLVLPMGDKKLAGVAAEDIGRTAYGIFTRGADLIGKRVGVAGELLTGTELAEKLGRALKRPVRYQSVSFDAYRSFGFPGADDLGNMFQLARRTRYGSSRNSPQPSTTNRATDGALPIARVTEEQSSVPDAGQLVTPPSHTRSNATRRRGTVWRSASRMRHSRLPAPWLAVVATQP